MSLTVERSPARVCWHIKCNGILVCTADTRKEANDLVDYMRVKYAL